MTEAVDVSELQTYLREYQDQIHQVEQLLLDDPENEEYKNVYEGLQQVIQLTTELLNESQQQQKPVDDLPPTTTPSIVAAITQAPDFNLPPSLPPHIAQQIKVAKQRAAILGDAPPEWAIGSEIQARFSGDGMWYDATISGVSMNGNFIVVFDSYTSEEEVHKMDVRERTQRQRQILGGGVVQTDHRMTVAQSLLPDASKHTAKGNFDAGVQQKSLAGRGDPEHAGAAAVTGVSSLSPGTIVLVQEEMPKWYHIKPDDDEKTIEKKRKLQKSFKNKQRLVKKDVEQKQKADAWKSFMTKKGGKKKSGFLTGLKKESMFRAPEEHSKKVGVVAKSRGSGGGGGGGGGVGARKRHEFGVDNDDGMEG